MYLDVGPQSTLHPIKYVHGVIVLYAVVAITWIASKCIPAGGIPTQKASDDQLHGLNEGHIAPDTDIEFQLTKYQTYIIMKS